ncbi:MAG: PaaI family thioesterase [Gemmatimonadetes bacterium]|nr:PaaI family thioesterase [Gemmatimonadota bacterium]MCY3612882.1 PaaI family thioesterase [Gemmatimonadota bacterium]MCY3676665.1 PaaI family thioesterase [Gemmatimonadota bacterium]MYA43117.1 PaaI family thioesterase [Gemmatimonadota bacterium]MYE93395.1 PaaI family thioesterase [Gemmatimonadota bacterium]
MPPKNTESWKLIESVLSGAEAIIALGITLHDMSEDGETIVLRMAKRHDLTRGDGTVYHGGPIASLIDIAGDMVVAVRAGGGVPTISLRVDYLRPSTGPYLLATARLRRGGRTISVSDVDVHDDQGRLCAVGRGTYSSIAG